MPNPEPDHFAGFRQGLGDEDRRRSGQARRRTRVLAIHLQADIDNHVAQRLYRHCGFLPAQIGPQMLRMVRWLNYPLLTAFQDEFPLAQFSNEPAMSGDFTSRTLRWSDPITASTVALGLSVAPVRATAPAVAPASRGGVQQGGDPPVQRTEAVEKATHRKTKWCCTSASTTRVRPPHTGCRRLPAQSRLSAPHRNGRRHEL